MKTNIFIRVRENEFANVKYIKSKIGNFKDKKVLYLGPGDGFYIDSLNMNNQCELVCVDVNKEFSDHLNLKGIKCYNQNFLDSIDQYINYFDIIFSFSFVQYVKPKYLMKFNNLCRDYLKDDKSFAIHLSIPNSKKFRETINYSYKFNKINIKGLLVHYIYFYFRGKRFEIKNKSYWHNPDYIKSIGGKNVKVSDTNYRFEYKLTK